MMDALGLRLRQPCFRHLPLCAFIWVLVCSQQPVLADSLDDVLQSLNKRQALSRTILYKIRGTQFVAKASLGNSQPLHDYSGPTSALWKMDFSNNWLLMQRQAKIFSASLNDFKDDNYAIYSDGLTMKTFGPWTKELRAKGYSEKMADVSLKTLKPNSPPWNAVPDRPLFYYHGQLFTADHSGLFYQKLQSRLNRHAFQDFELKALSGVNCIVVRSKLYSLYTVEYWFDIGKAYSVIKVDIVGKAGLLRQRTVIWPRSIEWGWIPEKWETTLYDDAGSLVSSEQQFVDEVKINEPYEKSDFEGEVLPPNTIVKDHDKKNTYLKVNADGNLVAFVPDSAPSTNPIWRILIYTALASALVFCAILVYRTYKRRKKARLT